MVKCSECGKRFSATEIYYDRVTGKKLCFECAKKLGLL